MTQPASSRLSARRRRLLLAGASWPLMAALPVVLPFADVRAQTCGTAWPQWDVFAQRHLQADGRIIDFSVPTQQSTSESQSYGMFFALVANDRARFASLWRWSRDNLGAGGAKLPAWQWGQREGGGYGVIDPNAAADADAWFAYALLEAGRLWQMPEYDTAGRALLAQIKAQEVRDLPGLGPMLLPGPVGFEAGKNRWRLNPSYLPLPLLRRFAAADNAGPWNAMAQATARMMTQSSPHGYPPDWVVYDADKGFLPDSERSVSGSYDAIRVYLWAGMTDEADPLAAAVRNVLAPMIQAVVNYAAPPERIDTTTGAPQGRGPVGFSAAMLPYLRAMRQEAILQAQQRLVEDRWQAWRRASQAPGAAGDGEFNYYNSVLTLFGLGWLQGHYRFDAAGSLWPDWRCRG